MKIRSITYFFNPHFPLDPKKLHDADTFLRAAKSAYTDAGYEVQTTRLATPSFTQIVDDIAQTPVLASELASALENMDAEYASLGPALPNLPQSYAIIPEAIAASDNIFFSAEMASAQSGISLPAVNACADVIIRSSKLDANGFSNLRFTASANVAAGGPFFPAAYHRLNVPPAFSLALEAADLAVLAFNGTNGIAEGRKNLLHALESHAKKLSGIAKKLQTKFYGLDFSLAPFPDDAVSLGKAIEGFGVPKAGMHGSLAAAAILAETVQKADFPHIGFNGMMMPVLEDATLAKRAAEGTLLIKDLLLYSAVCGTGLDTVPLAGDVRKEQVAALLLDLSALALRLAKPLTARLMPIPGKQAGDKTDFDFAFFTNSRVMGLAAADLQYPLRGDEIVPMMPRGCAKIL